MNHPFTITKAQARRFILKKQGLLGPMVFKGQEGVLAYIHQAGCIQYDPVDACGRNADLVLQSRVKGYKKEQLYALLYESRRLVDYWDKCMSIMPVEDWPYFRRIMAAYAAPENRSHTQIEEAAPLVREKLAALGPSFSGDLSMGEKIDWYWSATTVSRAALEALYFRGELCIHAKRGTQKSYDFAQNLLPGDVFRKPDPHPEDDAHFAWRVRRRIGAVGMLWNKPSDAYLGISGMKGPQRNQAFADLLVGREILPIAVEGIKDTLYLRSEDEDLLTDILEGQRFSARTQAIAPLDCMMWDRRLIEALFGFYYRWEIYTPPAQRKYGYYVLPVVHGESFMGRIEMVCNRKENALEVRNYWPEAGVRQSYKGLAKCIENFAVFHGVKQIRNDVKEVSL